MTSTTRAGRLPLAAAAAFAALALAACSSSPAPASDSAAGHPSATPMAHGPTVAVPQYVAAENARRSVVAGACKADGAKGWLLSGTITNSTKSRHRYSIVVDFVTAKGDTVMDTKVVRTATVAPGKTSRWHATGAAGHSGINCVVREALDRA